MTTRAAPIAAALLACLVIPSTAGADPHQAGRPAVMRMAQAHGSGPAAAPTGETVRAGSLTISQPWTRATPGGAKVAGGYLRITNAGSEPDRLTGGTFPIAARVEVHEMATQDGVMRMRQIQGGLVIRPGETVELKPGGLHVMFMDLGAGLKEGDTVRGTLVFERAGPVEIGFRVGPAGTTRAPDAHHH